MIDKPFDLSEYALAQALSELDATPPEREALIQALSDIGSSFPERFSHSPINPTVPTTQKGLQEAFDKLLATHQKFIAAEEQVQTLNPNSVSQAVIDHLVTNGMFESQAEQVLNIVKGRNEAMDGRWEDNKTDYPDVMLRVIILDADLAAVEWIDKNLPQAFFRPMFANRIPNNS